MSRLQADDSGAAPILHNQNEATPIPEPAAIDAEAAHAQAGELSAHLLVVYNQKDPDSQGLAAYYAARRGIALNHVVAIDCPLTEEITRAQFDDTIREPITSYLVGKGWMDRQHAAVTLGTRGIDLLVATRNDIWAIVLMRGVPLKIAPDPSDESAMQNEPALLTNAAAVDSELALLPIFGLPKGGFVPNYFFDPQGRGTNRVGPELAKRVILVTRLDGPRPADVRRMIDDSLYAETNRLAGLAVIDSRGLTDVKSGYTVGDTWLRSARADLLQDGWTVKFDDKDATLPATDPCNQVALYLGWYAAQANGPWVTAPNRFVRGAIAYHLHSYSAATVRSATECWVGPLIAHGAAATMGTVYEPYLPLTPHEDIFTRRLLAGDYFAEAAYASQEGLSWMVTVVGDPLYRPFLQPLESAQADTGAPRTAHDDWLLLQQVQREIAAKQIEDTTDVLVQKLDLPGVGAVADEGLGDLLEKLSDADAASATEQAYGKALEAATAPLDRIRIGLKLAQFYSNEGRDTRAQAQLDDLRQHYPVEARRFGVGDTLVPTVIPPSNAPPSPTTPVSDPVPEHAAPSSNPTLPSLPKQPAGAP